MARIFWVECPECGEDFHVHYGELRNSEHRLWCPTCGHRFRDSESPSVVE